MSQEAELKRLREERAALVDRILAPPVEQAWSRVRETLIASPPARPSEPLPTVWEGPTRAYLLPLPYEVLDGFFRRYPRQAPDIIYHSSSDPNPLIAAYALRALYRARDERFRKASESFRERTERIFTRFGCFAWEGTLSEYADYLSEDFMTPEETANEEQQELIVGSGNMTNDRPSPKWKRVLRVVFLVYAGLCTLLVTGYIVLILWTNIAGKTPQSKAWVAARHAEYKAKEQPKRGDYFCSLATMLGQYSQEASVSASEAFMYLGRPDEMQGTTNAGVLLYFFTPSYTTNRYTVLAFLRQGKLASVGVSDGTTYDHTAFQPFLADSAPNQQGGANGRQPFSSDTNRTSAAAASRRSP